MANVVRLRSSFNQGSGVTINIGVVNVHDTKGVENNPFHVLMAFIFFVLIGFLQIRYPGNPTSFEVHPKTMFVSMASFLLYCLAFWIKIKFATRVVEGKIDTLLQMSGSLSIISLVMMFFPKSWGVVGYIVIYTLWFICHVFVMIIGLRSHIRKKSQPILPNSSIDLD